MSAATFPILTSVVRATALSATCLAAALILSPTGQARAGPNAGGVLVVHDTGLTYCQDSDYYPSSPPYCPDADTELPLGEPPPGTSGYVWKVYAAFPAWSSPRLKALAMGSAFPPEVLVLAGGLPDPAVDFEVIQGGWPSVSGGGVGIAFGVTQTAQVVECYWLAGYDYTSPALWAVTLHPNPMYRFFVDDALPPNEDPIVGYGSIGFGEPGYNPCQEQVWGACCFFVDCTCQVLLLDACESSGGFFYGAWLGCDPNPCDCPPPGACCLPDGNCEWLYEGECLAAGGSYLGYSVSCDPNPCPPIPVQESSWGRLKQTYH